MAKKFVGVRHTTKPYSVAGFISYGHDLGGVRVFSRYRTKYGARMAGQLRGYRGDRLRVIDADRYDA
jgi:hypothetical protein